MNIESTASPLDVYLHTIETYLRPLPRMERKSILEEIASRIEELRFFNNCSIESALGLLGEPKALAKQYLEGMLKKGEGLNVRTPFIILSLYKTGEAPDGLVLFALSASSLCAILFGIVSIVGGFIETGRYIMGYGSASALSQVGPLGIHPSAALLVSFLLGIVLIAIGILCWHLLKKQDLVSSKNSANAGTR